MKAYSRASMPGYEGILTLAIRMRVSPKPMKKKPNQMWAMNLPKGTFPL